MLAILIFIFLKKKTFIVSITERLSLYKSDHVNYHEPLYTPKKTLHASSSSERTNEPTQATTFCFLGKTNDARVACDDWIDWRKWLNLERALKWTITKKDIFNRHANAALSSLFCSFLLLYKHYEAELLLHVKAASLRHHLTIFCLFLEKMYVGYSNSIVLVFLYHISAGNVIFCRTFKWVTPFLFACWEKKRKIFEI